MFKFIKNLFTKKKQFTLDDLNLSDRVELKMVDIKDGYWHEVYFMHPLYKELWPMPSRRVSNYSKWTLLKKGSCGFRNKDILTIIHWNKSDIKNRFSNVNELAIYFDSLERKYNELHP